MVKMREKQNIILRYVRAGESIRKMSRETGMSRRTVSKYVSEYLSHKEAVGQEAGVSSSGLIEQFVEAPSYNSSTRTKRKLTTDLVERVKRCLAENEQTRCRGQHKQQLKKIDIHELLCAEGDDISYSRVCLQIRSLETRAPESFIKQSYKDGQICEFDWGPDALASTFGFEVPDSATDDEPLPKPPLCCPHCGGPLAYIGRVPPRAEPRPPP